ncbi:hypothetical protein TeGR_g6070, partial [Tetraparma gracilis]
MSSPAPAPAPGKAAPAPAPATVKAARFWDAHHASLPPEEWILSPSPKLLELLAASLPEPGVGRPHNVLEIGAGTSALGHALLHHLSSAPAPQMSQIP